MRPNAASGHIHGDWVHTPRPENGLADSLSWLMDSNSAESWQLVRLLVTIHPNWFSQPAWCKKLPVLCKRDFVVLCCVCIFMCHGYVMKICSPCFVLKGCQINMMMMMMMIDSSQYITNQISRLRLHLSNTRVSYELWLWVRPEYSPSFHWITDEFHLS